MESKFKVGDTVYSIYVDEYLIVNINKLVVESMFFNSLPQYNIFIYSCKGLEQTIIRDFELPLTKEEIEDKDSMFSSIRGKRNPGATISSSSRESGLYLKSELEQKIQFLLEERKEMNKRVADAAEKFRCPLTGGKMTRQKDDFMITVLDGPTYYNVEGSNIMWEEWPRMDEIYETKVDGINHAFRYLGGGEWEEYRENEEDNQNN